MKEENGLSERIYTDVVDRTGWCPGPWDDEPDKVQWADAATGLPCLALRHPAYGSWCGYAGVDEAHPLHGKDFEDVELYAWGGVNYSAPCQVGAPEAEGICHVPEPGQSDGVWWFGFACSSLFDYKPALAARMHEIRPDGPLSRTWPYDHEASLQGAWSQERYATLAVVQREVAGLAVQLAEVKR